MKSLCENFQTDILLVLVLDFTRFFEDDDENEDDDDETTNPIFHTRFYKIDISN